MTLNVFTEIGPLRRVLIHRPGREIDDMVPAMMEHLLFDDILDGIEAREEHDTFVALLNQLGVETLDTQDLLAEVLEEDEPRQELLNALERRHRVPAPVVRELEQMDPPDLTLALVGGLRAKAGGRQVRWSHYFDLLPVPNYFFQRDPQIVIGDRVISSSMATEARERESLLSRLVFRHHPALAGHVSQFEIHQLPHPAPDYGPAYPFPTLEGGDVLVVSPEVLLVGMSERTNRRGVEVLAQHLCEVETSFRHLFAVELPPTRAYMHLDTVFTIVDHGQCLGCPSVVLDGSPETARVYDVDLGNQGLTFTVRPPLLEALTEVGIELEMIPAGGADFVDQQREQWTDGANAFAVAPGVIFLYERNRKTTEELARRGWRLIRESEALTRHDLLDGEPTAITFAGRELSRARGGPRCMTMPLEREEL